MYCHVAMALFHFLHVSFPWQLAYICLTSPTLSIYLCLGFLPGSILVNHWLKQLYSLANKATHTEGHPTSGCPIAGSLGDPKSFSCLVHCTSIGFNLNCMGQEANTRHHSFLREADYTHYSLSLPSLPFNSSLQYG